MTIDEVWKYYDNEIDKVQDGVLAEELFNMLQDAEDLLSKIETEIGKALEEQQKELAPSYYAYDEFNYMERMP